MRTRRVLGGMVWMPLLLLSCGEMGPTNTESRQQAVGASYCSGVSARFCDDFQDNNTTGWTMSGGSWGVITDGDYVLRQNGSGSPAVATIDSTAGMGDQAVQGSMKILQFGGTTSAYRAGLVARYSSSTNTYVFALDGARNLVLLKGTTAISGTGCTAVASGLTNLATWNTYRIQVSGSAPATIRTFFNGTQIHNCVISSGVIGTGKSGVFTYGTNTRAEFDAVTVNMSGGLCQSTNGAPKAAGTVCRAANGLCDSAEVCSGKSLDCPADTYRAAGVVCRSAAGICDVAESCTGTSPACPVDGFVLVSQACRPSAGPCDPVETCSGLSASCPADVLAPASAICRPSAGACDPAEYCSGSSSQCPGDIPAGPPTTPVNVVASAGNAQVALTWDESTRATNYKIKRSKVKGGPYTQVATVSGRSHTDTNLQNGVDYYYVVTASAESCGDSSDSVEVTARPFIGATQFVTVAVVFPSGLGVQSVPVGANGALRIRDRAKIKSSSGAAAPASNAGATETDIGADCQMGNLTSAASVFLRERAKVYGDLKTAGVLTRQNGTVVSGSITQNATLTPLASYSWKTLLPATDSGDVVLGQGVNKALSPGSYGNVAVNGGATLSLKSGIYHMKSFYVEWSGKLSLDMSGGPVVVYVSGVAAFRGELLKAAGPDGNFLLVALGTDAVFVETQFVGTIVAPNASLTLGGGTTTVHRGGFYARDVELRADVSVAAGPFSWTGVGPGDCWVTDDTDRDGVLDCVDHCPYDPDKTEPGICNCGTPDTDSDGDGVPDCLERECANDPNKTSKGQCGCQGHGVKPAGTPCNDYACPQSGGQLVATCDGNGICGDRSTCEVGPNCRLVTWEGSSYWFCGVWGSSGRLPRGGAQTACSAKGMKLVRISSPAENAFIQSLIGDPVWVGANALATAEDWRWSTPTSNDGDQFWSGGANGTRVNGFLVNWASGAPGSEICASMRSADGQWADTPCTEVLGYVCEYAAPLTGGGPTERPNVPAQPPPTGSGPCVDEVDSGLPIPADDSEEERLKAQAILIDQIALADAGIFKGAAANPPEAGATCTEKMAANALGAGSGSGCELINTQPGSEGCKQDSDCKTYGSQYVCRRTKVEPNCNPPDINPGRPVLGETCPGKSVCGIVVCPTDPLPCDEKEICNPGSEVDAGLDPLSNMDASTLDPASLFPNGRPDGGAPTYQDPPTGTGVAHSWCTMKTQDPDSVPTATSPVDDKHGESGGGSTVKFKFDPDLVFDVSANPLSLGENNLSLHAQAKLVARVELNNFLGQSFGADIISAVADITAKRCSLNTDGTEFRILELDVIDPADLPRINTNDKNSVGETIYQFSKDCNAAIEKYQEMANRAKKAFRDAQQLVKQYHDLKTMGKLLSSNLCDILGLGIVSVPGFPGGAKCYSNESVEAVINRFIDYYQAPGLGQVSQLRQAAGVLSDLTSKLKNALSMSIDYEFKDADHEESQTIVDVPFAIGPVPMLLQIDLATRYGIGGEFGLDLNFPSNLLDGPEAPPSQIAHVGASVLPHAAAALSAFVGAGFGYGPIHASVGIEGSVNLADIRVPIFAGAGLQMQVLADTRLLPTELAPPVSLAADAFQFKIPNVSLPKAFKFKISYDYGAAVELHDVLAGEIKGKVRIKFWMFSRTWRKRIVKFNGWSKHFDLVKGGGSADISIGDEPKPVPNTAQVPDLGSSAPILAGRTEMGQSQSEVPLMQLAYLQPVQPGEEGIVPDGGVPDGGPELVSFDPASMQKPFYDDLCCAKDSEPCRIDGKPFPVCCPNLVCKVPSGGVTGTCGPECQNNGGACASDNQCCSGLICGSAGACRVCGIWGAACGSDSDCCKDFGYYCMGGFCGNIE